MDKKTIIWAALFGGLFLGLAGLAIFFYSEKEWRWLAYEGALLAVIANARYCYTTIYGSTRPPLISWFLWATTSCLGFWASLNAGAKDGAIVAGAYAFVMTSIFLLVLCRPKLRSKGHEAYEWLIAIALVVGLILCWENKSPLLPLLIAIAVDGYGILKTWEHAMDRPWEEDLLAWSLDIPAAVLGVLAVGSYVLIEVAWMAFTAAGVTLIAMTLALQQRAHPRAKTLPEKIEKPVHA